MQNMALSFAGNLNGPGFNIGLTADSLRRMSLGPFGFEMVPVERNVQGSSTIQSIKLKDGVRTS